MIVDAKESLFQNYFSNNYSYDELLGDDGTLRPHWQTFFNSFSQLGPAQIQDRAQDILRFLKENGVTYNVYGDSSGLNRPWNLDVIPFLISQQEWQKIESGLVQRATLFDLILKDLYGERLLIKEGLLPLELIYNHSGFLRQCDGVKLPGKHSLILYSADIARSPEGKIWVLNDRTQAPSGSGYALENRTAITRILPELFSGLKVRHLSPYFIQLRDSLHAIAPAKALNPRIVILTPGPSNETYFEHSYLSSYLGYTLVQGEDLMVKDNYVWLKTIGGLEKVDVIIRRVDDIYCDPLELKEDSRLGVSGLLQAVRSGNVSIANPLGSSVLENPGLMGFLPRLARHFFGEDLILPTIASWWCGQPMELKYVLDNIESLVVKKIYRESRISTSVNTSNLSKNEIEKLKLDIQAQPHLYVGQEKIAFSSTPSLISGKIEPRNVLFRSFLVATDDTYTCMTGGLGRTSAEPGNFVISNQLGGISKDTWIISPEPGYTLSSNKDVLKTKAPSFSGVLPSHTAENLFWVGRYAERVLGNARFQRTIMQLVAEGNRLQFDNDIKTEQLLLKTLTEYTCTYPGFTGADAAEKFKNPWPELTDLLFNTHRQGSLSNNFSLFTKAVNTVRDHWSTDTWRVLKGMEDEWEAASKSQLTNFRMISALDNLITSMVAFIGLNRESISREQGWNLLDTGRKVEQSLLLISVLQSTLTEINGEEVEYNLQEAVLKSHETLMNYRYKYKVHIQLPLMLELMLLDTTNPRSLIYQIERLKAYLSSLPKTQKSATLEKHERLILEAFTLLKLADNLQLAQPDEKTGTYKNLEELLDTLSSLLLAIPKVISKKYFKHAQGQKQLFAAEDDKSI
ncbi:circularly permuted type 2 ATP-grasp protein [Ferruginibacter sp. SUN002]|uniref:circularly permuted type 2 ATP-grasp protein n=1 Tax=Ferruginibacter sp. SUN002 TaxID=2937789 RepID=UPI003D367C1F